MQNVLQPNLVHILRFESIPTKIVGLMLLSSLIIVSLPAQQSSNYIKTTESDLGEPMNITLEKTGSSFKSLDNIKSLNNKHINQSYIFELDENRFNKYPLISGLSFFSQKPNTKSQNHIVFSKSESFKNAEELAIKKLIANYDNAMKQEKEHPDSIEERTWTLEDIEESSESWGYPSDEEVEKIELQSGIRPRL